MNSSAKSLRERADAKKEKSVTDRTIGPYGVLRATEATGASPLAGLTVHTASTRNVSSYSPLISLPFRSTKPTLRHPGTHPRIFIYLRGAFAPAQARSRSSNCRVSRFRPFRGHFPRVEHPTSLHVSYNTYTADSEASNCRRLTRVRINRSNESGFNLLTLVSSSKCKFYTNPWRCGETTNLFLLIII